MTTGSRKTHDFCWLNLMTPEAERARAFFSRVLGWAYGEMPGVPGGTLILVGGRAAGAIMDLDVVKMPPGSPPEIGVMIKVERADDTVAKINAAGGHAGAAFDVLENGRMATCTDPNGAVFGLWQPKKEVGIEADSRAHGAPTWFETMTRDVGRAARFYADVFGWTAVAEEMPGMTCTRFDLDGVPIAGAMPAHGAAADVPPHWGTYFAVEDADAAARVAEAAGGTICLAPRDLPGIGRFGLLQSPQGVPFHVIAYGR